MTARLLAGALLALLLPTVTNAQPYIPADATLLAHYPLRVDGTDTLGNWGEMVLSNVTFEDGGASFNGRYIGTDPSGSDGWTPDITDLNLDRFAVVARFKAAEAFRGPVFVVGDAWRIAGFWLFPDSTMSGMIDGQGFNIRGEVQYTPGVWHEAGIIHDRAADTLLAFLDGELVDQRAASETETIDQDVGVTQGGTGNTFFGVLADLRVYNLETVPLSSDREDPDAATGLRLEVFPTPTRGRLNIRFDAPTQSSTEVRVADVLGRIVAHEQLAGRGSSSRGRSRLDLDVPAGLYLVTVEQDGISASQPVVVVGR